METDYFAVHLLPQLEKTTEEMNADDIRWLQKHWKRFEKIAGIQALLTAEDHPSILQIFELAITGDHG